MKKQKIIMGLIIIILVFFIGIFIAGTVNEGKNAQDNLISGEAVSDTKEEAYNKGFNDGKDTAVKFIVNQIASRGYVDLYLPLKDGNITLRLVPDIG